MTTTNTSSKADIENDRLPITGMTTQLEGRIGSVTFYPYGSKSRAVISVHPVDSETGEVDDSRVGYSSYYFHTPQCSAISYKQLWNLLKVQPEAAAANTARFNDMPVNYSHFKVPNPSGQKPFDEVRLYPAPLSPQDIGTMFENVE